VLNLQAIGTDPSIARKVNWIAKDFLFLRLSVKNYTKSGRLQIYYTTQDDPAWNESKSTVINIETGSNDFREYSTQMGGSWKGTVTAVRIDPTDAVGKYVIDYIIFSGKQDEKAQILEPNMIRSGNMDDKSFQYSTRGALAAYSADKAYNGRYSLDVIKQDANGALSIPVTLKNDVICSFDFWIYMSQAGNVQVGTIDWEGSKNQPQTFKVEQAGIWKEIKGNLKGTEVFGDSGFYISTDTQEYYIDAVTLRMMKKT